MVIRVVGLQVIGHMTTITSDHAQEKDEDYYDKESDDVPLHPA